MTYRRIKRRNAAGTKFPSSLLTTSRGKDRTINVRSKRTRPLQNGSRRPNVRSPRPIEPEESTTNGHDRPILTIPVKRFIRMRRRKVMNESMDKVSMSIRILIPTEGAFNVNFSTRDIRFTLTRKNRNNETLSNKTRLNFVHRRVVTGIMTQDRRLLSITTRYDRNTYNFHTPTTLFFPLLPISINHFFLCIFRSFKGNCRLSHFLRRSILLWDRRFFLRGCFCWGSC